MEAQSGGKGQKDSDRLVVKLTRRRKLRYETAADVEDLSLSEWVRRVLDDAAGKLLASTETKQPNRTGESEGTGTAAPAVPSLRRPGSGQYVLVPVIGRTSAGTARYWSDLDFNDTGIVSSIERRLYDLAGVAPQRSCEGALLRMEKSEVLAVSLIQYNVPDAHGILEFISIPKPEGRQQVVAWRVDGDSMTPQYRDGDFVLVSPEVPAEDGFACVAHQKDQLGVNCKIFRRIGAGIILIPINENYATQQIPANRVEWAFRVLSRVRLMG